MKKDLVAIEPIKRGGVLVFDEQNPRSVYNLLPRKIKESIKRLYTERPDLTNRPEVELHRILHPTDDTDRLRISFWQEYTRAQDHGTRMRSEFIFSPVMSHEMFYGHYLPKNEVVAWMIIPPQEYMVALEGFLNHAKEQLGSLLKMPLFDEHGKLKVKEANIFLKAYELLDSRVKGSVIQRIEQRTQSLQVTATHADLRKELEALSSKETLFLDKPSLEHNVLGPAPVKEAVAVEVYEEEAE